MEQAKWQGFCLICGNIVTFCQTSSKLPTNNVTNDMIYHQLKLSDFIGSFFHWPFEIFERKSLAQINAALHAVMRVFYWISRQFYLLNEFLSTSEIFIISFPGFVRTAPSPNDNTPISRSPLPNFVIHPKLGRVTLRLTWLLTASQLVLASPE